MLLQRISFDEDDVARKVLVDFCMQSDTLDPSAISLDLGIQPTRSFAKGEKYLGKQMDPQTKNIFTVWHERPWGIWAIDSESLVQTKRVEQHFVYLLNILEPKKEQIKRYLSQDKGFSVRFYVWWEPFPPSSSHTISSQVLARASELCHYIEFGFIYTSTDDEQSGSHSPPCM